MNIYYVFLLNKCDTGLLPVFRGMIFEGGGA
jgi:hypothetical protein